MPEVVTLSTLLTVPLPLLPKHDTVNQRLPSGPAVIEIPVQPLGIVYSVKLPVVVTLATLPPGCSMSHRLPSRPAAMLHGPLLALGMVYSVMVPTGAGDGRGAGAPIDAAALACGAALEPEQDMTTSTAAEANRTSTYDNDVRQELVTPSHGQTRRARRARR